MSVAVLVKTKLNRNYTTRINCTYSNAVDYLLGQQVVYENPETGEELVDVVTEVLEINYPHYEDESI
jgi:hypothetical protein